MTPKVAKIADYTIEIQNTKYSMLVVPGDESPIIAEQKKVLLRSITLRTRAGSCCW